MAKTVPSSKFIEWKGLDRISSIVHEEMRCIFRELSKDDFGIDGEIEVVTPKADGKGFETTGSIVKVQAKSGASFIVEDKEDAFSTPVRREDLDLWHRSTYPVLFIVYHPSDDKLYAKEVKSYISQTPSVFAKPYKIKFTKSHDEFNGSYYSQVANHARVSPPRLSFHQQEQFYSNLLPVVRLPKCYVAQSLKNSVDDLRKAVSGFLPPFTITNKKLYTLGDLRHRDSAFKDHFKGKIQISTGEDLLLDDERRRDYIYLLNRLLGLHNNGCGIRYNKDFKRNYFPRQNDEDLEFKLDWVSVRTGKKAPERIIAKYYKYGLFEFWRHLAASMSFVQFGSNIYLQIIPKYFFTKDGEAPCDSDLVGAYTTRVKAREFNPQVLNHVLFWSHVLSQGQDAIRFQLYGRPILVIEKKPLVGLSPFAIPSDPATFEEKFPSEQIDLFADLKELRQEDMDEF